MKFIINGGKSLKGEVAIFGSKNAATPVIAATLLTESPCVLENIPRVSDALTMLEILKSMGSEQSWIDDHTLRIANHNIDPKRINQNLVCKIRSSILLLGPLLARFGKVELATPGGCQIGARPIDTHLEAFKALGAEVLFDDKSGLYRIVLDGEPSTEVVLREASVTATENLLMLGFKRPLTIKIAATEPHVVCLGSFLENLGASIEGLGHHIIKIKPAPQKLSKELKFSIINDEIEMGTFAILGATTKGKIAIKGFVPDQLNLVLEKLKEMGVVFSIDGNCLLVNGPACNMKAAKIEARVYPGIPSDLQALFGVLATQAHGTSLIFDTLYEGRLKYIDELKKMGADATILDPHRALIKGPAVLHGTIVQSLDLRAGATLVIAALVAKGESVLGGAEQIDRGYERFDERLRALGADIKRIND